MRGYVWCLYFNRYNILPFLDSIFRLYEHVAVQDAKIIEQAENLMKRNQNCTNNNSSSMPVEGLYFNKNRSQPSNINIMFRKYKAEEILVLL